LKTVIICSEIELQQSLKLQLLQRSHSVRWIEAAHSEELLNIETDAAESLLVIDCASGGGGDAAAFAEDKFKQAVQHSAERGWPYLLLSDCRVFPGNKQRYRETDQVEPHSVVGVTLALREKFLIATHPQCLVLRVGPILSSAGDSLLMRLLGLLRAGGTVYGSSEPRFCPVAIDDLARVMCAIVDQIDCAAQCWGIYHYNSSDATPPYEFAEAVLAAASQYWPLVDHVRIAAAPSVEWSGNYPQLNCHLIRDTFGIQQLTWRKAIADLMKRIHAGEVP
jgi:dTDP-4-dehydrorhamnose reductase